MVTQVCAAANASLALTKDGEVWQWGFRENETTGEEESIATPYRVRFSDAPIVSVSACGCTYAAVDRLGFVYMWGVMPQPDDIVQTTSSSHSPTVTEVFVRRLTQERYVDRPIRLDSAVDHFVVDVAVGSQFAALLTDDGRVLAFGEHPAHGRGIDDFLYSITSTFDASVVRPPHQLDLFTGKPDTRALAIICDRAWTQVLTEEGEVHYLGGDFTYLARRLALPDGMRARRMFPGFVVCDTAAAVRNDPAGRYSRFAQLARASELQNLDEYMRQCREERRVKLNEEWSVMSPTHKIELREKQEKLVVVKWRCPAWWTSRAIKGDCIALRVVTDGTGDDHQPHADEARVLLQDSTSANEATGQGEVVFPVSYRPEGRYRFVYLRKLADSYEERATSQPVTIAQGAEVSGEDALYRFPLAPLNFTKMASFVACAPVKACAKLLVEDLQKAERECSERTSDRAKIALQTLLLCEDYTRNTCASFVPRSILYAR